MFGELRKRVADRVERRLHNHTSVELGPPFWISKWQCERSLIEKCISWLQLDIYVVCDSYRLHLKASVTENCLMAALL
jgi:hypothetical protein